MAPLFCMWTAHFLRKLGHLIGWVAPGAVGPLCPGESVGPFGFGATWSIYITGAYVLRIQFLVFPHLSFASGRMPYLSGKRRPLFAVSRWRLNSHYTPKQYYASGRGPTLGRSQRILSEPLLYTPRIRPRLGSTRQHTTASHWSRCKDYRHTHTRHRPEQAAKEASGAVTAEPQFERQYGALGPNALIQLVPFRVQGSRAIL